MYRVVETIVRPDPALIEGLRTQFPTAITRFAGRRQAMSTLVRPLAPGWRIAGPAVTVKLDEPDLVPVALGLKLAQNGDVLVIDEGGSSPVAVWGPYLSFAAQAKGLAGMVTDGTVQELARHRDLGFPVFCRGVSTLEAPRATPGSINVPVICGGVIVNPGDIVVANDDGVMVVPAGEAGEVLWLGTEWANSPPSNNRQRVLAGETPFDLMGLQAILDRFPIRYERGG